MGKRTQVERAKMGKRTSTEMPSVMTCSSCHVEKSFQREFFTVSKHCRHGLSMVCRECCIERRQAWRRKNRDKLAARRRELYVESEKVVEARRAAKRWREDSVRMRAQVLRSGIVSRARELNLNIEPKFRVTKFWADYLRRQPTCECCGVEFQLVPSEGTKSDSSPSIDRFVPSLGYVIGNVSLLCWRCNNLKRDATPEELFTIANWMADKIKEQERWGSETKKFSEDNQEA